MSGRAKIIIDGAFAGLHGVSVKHLRDSLRVKDPKCFFNRAYKEGRWNGYVDLYAGRHFPAGLHEYVARDLSEKGIAVETEYRTHDPAVDASGLKDDYLPGITLWPHQMRAIMAMLESDRGVVKSPTGSGKSEDIFAVARYLWEHKDYRSFIVVPKAGLLVQTVERFEKYAQGDFEIGQLGDGVKKLGPITVATAQTLIGFRGRKRKGRRTRPDELCREVIENYEVMFLDETHHASADTWYEIALQSVAVRRYGLSGTPLTGDTINDLRLQGATGPIICSIEADELIENELAAKPKIAMVVSDNASGPELPKIMNVIVDRGVERVVYNEMPYADAYTYGYIENESHNTAVIRAVTWLVDRGKQTLILCRRKSHFTRLAEMLEESGVSFVALWGDDATSERVEGKQAFKEKRINAILATTIFDEGEDVGGIEALVLAEGIKKGTSTIQRIGRGMRKDSSDVWVVEIVPTCHGRLMEHACNRADAYEREGYEVVVVDRWPSKDDKDYDDDKLLPFLHWDEAASGVF